MILHLKTDEELRNVIVGGSWGRGMWERMKEEGGNYRTVGAVARLKEKLQRAKLRSIFPYVRDKALVITRPL